MKKIRLLILFSIIAFPGYVSGYDVLVSMSGTVIGNSCTIATDSQHITVPLGDISVKDFRHAGDISNLTSKFVIQLRNCYSAFNGVKVLFSGEGDSRDDRYLKINEGDERGIAVQLLNSDGETIALNRQGGPFGILGEAEQTITFYARYISMSNRIMPGKTTATATYVLEYL